MQDLTELDATDVLLRFDNKVLAAEMEGRLQQQSSANTELAFQDFQVSFKQQFIQLTTRLSFADDQGQVQEATAKGEIQLQASAEGLSWFLNVDQVQVLSSEIDFADNSNVDPAPDLGHQLLLQINDALKNDSPSGQFHHIAFQAVPLADIEVGTRLLSFDGASSIRSTPVRGMFFVTGSAILIDPVNTSILLDMNFKPNLATCPADVSVSRSMFATEINAREPVRALNSLDKQDDLKFYFSEIAGASRPMTVIHYWFADGQPVAVAELPVGPSDKWRTWSSKGNSDIAATHWRVLVVEKESGCIMHSQTIRTDSPLELTNTTETDTRITDYIGYRDAFNLRAADFAAATAQPDTMSTSVRRQFLNGVIQAGIKDLQIETPFDQTDQPSRNYRAGLLPFDVQDISCQEQNCAEPIACSANIAHCARKRDVRECNSCLFHNPLNNRCISTEKDPICTAAKNRQNALYESDWEVCLANAELGRQDCQQLGRQITQSCEIENQLAKSACESSKTEILSIDNGTMLATITADSQINGQLSAVFSNFVISENFDQLQQNITLKTRLQIQGELKFETASTQWPLGSCIDNWQGPFSSRIISSIPLNSMLTSLNDIDNSFRAEWSGIVLPLKMNASPLESVFVSSPRLLATCNIGLTVQKVEQAVLGTDAGFFTGGLKLMIQPTPTRILLRPATMQLAGTSYTGIAVSQAGFVSYTLQPE
jgi:hypothetical protein